MTIENLMEEATKYYFKNDFYKSLFYLKTILEMDDYNFEANLLISRIYYKFSEYEEGLIYVNKLYRYYSNSSEVLFMLGLFNRELKKYKKAITYYEKSLEVEEKYEVHLHIMVCYMELKFYKKGLEYVEKIIKKYKKETEIYFFKLDFYQKIGKFKMAMEIIENEIAPLDDVMEYEVYMLIAECYYARGEIEKAIENYRISISFDDILSTLPYEKFFELLLNESKFEEIELLIINYKNSIFPKSAPLLMEVKFSLFYIKDYERAKRSCEQLILLESDNPKNYFYIIEIYNKLNDIDKALEMLEKLKKMPVDKNEVRLLRNNLMAKKRRMLKNKNIV